ncbi:MAG: Holliday junction resolvase RuvX [Gammaproteobacteria bacterium]
MKMARPATILAFDYGRKRIGIAVGQTVTATATPLTSVPARQSRPGWESISELVRLWEPDVLVVGLPLNMDGTEQASTQDVRWFKRELEKRYCLPVFTADERLSTREARERLAAWGTRKTDDDQVAAQVILETWFCDGSDVFCAG